MSKVFNKDDLTLGMTREEVKALWGEPEDWGGTSRKYKTPCVYIYGDLELGFHPWKTGKLWYVHYRKDLE